MKDKLRVEEEEDHVIIDDGGDDDDDDDGSSGGGDGDNSSKSSSPLSRLSSPTILKNVLCLFLQDFSCKFKCNTASDWLNHMV